MGSLHKNNQLMLEFLKASFLFLYICHYALNDFPDDIICNIANYADDTSLYY